MLGDPSLGSPLLQYLLSAEGSAHTNIEQMITWLSLDEVFRWSDANVEQGLNIPSRDREIMYPNVVPRAPATYQLIIQAEQPGVANDRQPAQDNRLTLQTDGPEADNDQPSVNVDQPASARGIERPASDIPAVTSVPIATPPTLPAPTGFATAIAVMVPVTGVGAPTAQGTAQPVPPQGPRDVSDYTARRLRGGIDGRPNQQRSTYPNVRSPLRHRLIYNRS